MRLLSYIGIVCSLAAILASMAMNYVFMYEMGKTVVESQIYGWLSVAFDGLKSILPILIAAAFASGKFIKGLTGSVIFTFLVGFALLSAIGFAAGNRGAIVGSREAVTTQYKAATESLKISRSLLAEIKTKRSSKSISANMEAARQEKRWRSTKGCTDTTATASIKFCKSYFAQKAEYEDAKEAEKLREQIKELNIVVAKLKQKGAGKAADPQAGVIARLLPKNFELKDVQDGLVMFVAVLVELVAAFGLYLSTGLTYATQKQIKPKPQTKAKGETSRGGAKKPTLTQKKANDNKKKPAQQSSEPPVFVAKTTTKGQQERPERLSLEQSRALIVSK